MQLQLRQILSLTQRDFINKGFTFLSTLYKTSNKYYERRYNAHNVLKFQDSRPWSCILCGWTCNLSTLYIYSRTDGCMTWKLRGLRYVYIISSRRFNPRLETWMRGTHQEYICNYLLRAHGHLHSVHAYFGHSHFYLCALYMKISPPPGPLTFA